MRLSIILSTVLLCATYSHAAITITGANVSGYSDDSGGSLGAGVLAVLVVDTGNDGFGIVRPGLFDVGSTVDTDFIDGENDLIINIVDSETVFSDNFINGTRGGVSFEVTPTQNAAISSGNQFAIYWFPELSLANGDDSASAGDTYGVTRNIDWIIPGDGGLVDASPVLSAGRADQIVRAIPEPSSVALLGLGAVGLISRRRRD